ncbi:hypothetical protein ACLOJK_031201 [Asimina triloba]
MWWKSGAPPTLPFLPPPPPLSLPPSPVSCSLEESMKGKELQSLCKKHNLPANSTNQAMALALASLLKVEQADEKARRGRSCLKRFVESSADDGAEILKNINVKKVRFSPHEEFHVFEASPIGRYPLRNRNATRRPAAASRKVKKSEISVVEAVKNSDALVAGDRILVRSLRSRKIASVCGVPISRIQVELGDSGTKEENGPAETRQSVVGDDRVRNNRIQTRTRKKGNDKPKGNAEQIETAAVNMGLRRSKRIALAEAENCDSKNPQELDLNSSKCDKGTRKTTRTKVGERLKKGEVLSEEFGLLRTRSRKKGNENPKESGEQNDTGAVKVGLRRSKRTSLALDKMKEAESSNPKNQVFVLRNSRCAEGTRQMRKKAAESLKKDGVLNEEFGILRTRSQMQRKKESAKVRVDIMDLEEVHKKFKAENGADGEGAHCSKRNAPELAKKVVGENLALLGSDVIDLKSSKNISKTRSMAVSEKLKASAEVEEEVCLSKNYMLTRSKKQKNDNSAGATEILVKSELHGSLCDKMWAEDKMAQCQSKRNARKPHETATQKNTAIEISEVNHNKNYKRLRRNNNRAVSENSKNDGVFGREVVLSSNLRQTRSRKQKTNKGKEHEGVAVSDEVHHVLSGRISAKTGVVDEGTRQYKSNTFDGIDRENTKLKGSERLDADGCKYDMSKRKTRGSIALESLKNNEEVEREADSSEDLMLATSQKQNNDYTDELGIEGSSKHNAPALSKMVVERKPECEGSQELDHSSPRYNMNSRKRKSTSVNEGLNSDGELGRVVLLKNSMFTGTDERKNDNQKVGEEEIVKPDEVQKIDCKMGGMVMGIDKMTAEDPQLDRMVGIAAAHLKQSLKKGILLEEALDGEDGRGIKLGGVDIPNELAKYFEIKELAKRSMLNSCEVCTLSNLHTVDEIPINEYSVFEKMAADAGCVDGNEIRRLEEVTPGHALCVSCDGNKVTDDEILGKQMADVVIHADNPSYDCQLGGEFEEVVNDDNRADEGLSRSKSHTGEEKYRKFTSDSFDPSCGNSAAAEPKLVLHEGALLSAVQEECSEEGNLSWRTTDNIKKELASGQKSCRKKGFFKVQMAGEEQSSNESNRGVPPLTPVLTKTVLPEFRTVVLVGGSHSDDLVNREDKDCVGNLSIGNELEYRQCGGVQLPRAANSVLNHVSLVVNSDGGFHAERHFMPEKEIVEADKDYLAFSSYETQNSFRLNNELSGKETPIPKLTNQTCETLESPRGPHLEEMDVVVKEMTKEAVLESIEASVIQEAAAGPVAPSTSNLSLTSTLDAKPIDADEFGELKPTVATSSCKHDVHAGLLPARDISTIVQHDCGRGAEHLSPIEGYQDEEPSSGSFVDAGGFSFKATSNASEANDHKDQGTSNHKNVEEFIEDDEFAETADNASAIKYNIEDSEKDGVVQIDPGRNNPENAERLFSDRNEEAISDTSKERNGDSDISFENQNYTIVKEKTRGSQWEFSCHSFLACMEEKGSQSMKPNMGTPTTTSDTTKASNLVEDNVVLMTLTANQTSKEMKSSSGDSTVAKEMGRGCFGAVLPLEEGNSVVSNVIMVVDADKDLGLCENKNENYSEEMEHSKDGTYTESLGNLGLKNVLLQEDEVAISKAMEGMCQADISIEELGYQEMGTVVIKGTKEEAIVPCNDTPSVQEIAVRDEAAHENTGSFSFDPVFVHAIHVTDSIGTDGNSSVSNLDMGILGFSPEKVVDTAIELNTDGTTESADAQKVNLSTSSAKHFSSIQAIRNQGENLLLCLPVDSIVLGPKEIQLVSDSENHEDYHCDYHERFADEVHDKEFSEKATVKEFSEQAGAIHSNLGKIDEQSIEVNETSNKNFEVMKEQLADRYTHELGTADSISQKLDSSGSEEQPDANEGNSVVLERFKDSAESIVTNSAHWSLKSMELKFDSEEISGEKRNIVTLEETCGGGDGLEPEDEKENKVIFMGKCGKDFACVNLAESVKHLSGTAEIEYYANGTEERLTTNEVGDIVSEDIEEATLAIANDPADDFEYVHVKGKSQETTEEKGNVENTRDAVDCEHAVKPISQEDNSVISMGKYGTTVEQFVCAAPVESKEPLEWLGILTSEKFISPIDGLDFKNIPPRGNKDSGSPGAHISAEKQEKGPSQIANISESTKKFASKEENLFCCCDVVADSRNPIRKSSEFDLSDDSCMIKTLEGAGRSETETLIEKLIESSDGVKIPQFPSEFNCEEQASSRCTWEQHNGSGHPAIIKQKELDESSQEENGSMDSKEVMHDEENVGKQMKREIINDCSTGDVLVVEVENTDDRICTKFEEEKLSCEASEVVDTKTMVEFNAEKFSDLEYAQADPMESNKHFAAPEVEERASYLEITKNDSVHSCKEPDAPKGPEKDESEVGKLQRSPLSTLVTNKEANRQETRSTSKGDCNIEVDVEQISCLFDEMWISTTKATKIRNRTLTMQSKLINEMKENMPVMKEKANTHREVKSATPLRRRALENLQSSEKAGNERTRVFNY